MTQINGEGHFVSNIEWPPERRIHNLGKILGMCNKEFEVESNLLEDVRAWGAPSECRADVARHCKLNRIDLARKIEERTGFHLAEILDEAHQRLGRHSYHASFHWLAGIAQMNADLQEEAERQMHRRLQLRLATSRPRELR